MNYSCQKCDKTIPQNEPYTTLIYNIETASQNKEGHIVVQIISSNTIVILCKKCQANNNPKQTKSFLKKYVSQKGGQSN